MLIQRTPLNVQIKNSCFQYLESKGILGKPLMDMTLAEMDIFWEEAKKL
jgi:hypothetical protein